MTGASVTSTAVAGGRHGPAGTPVGGSGLGVLRVDGTGEDERRRTGNERWGEFHGAA